MTGRRILPKPFLKWAGGKGQLVDQIMPHIPADFGTYFEPFLGGGALFFALVRAGRLDWCERRLSDVNRELIDTYAAVCDRVQDVIDILKMHRYDRDHYLAVRAISPDNLAPPERAARMVYLNRCGYNGLYRVNSRGEFNVPFGRYNDPVICDGANLEAVSLALLGVRLRACPFEVALAQAREGDLVYLDPPYHQVSETSFVGYSAAGFSRADQEAVAVAAHELVGRGVHVILSNADTPWIRERYSTFRIFDIRSRRNINSKGGQRGPVGEVLVVGRVRIYAGEGGAAER